MNLIYQSLSFANSILLRFRNFFHIILLIPFYALCVFIIAVSLTPGIFISKNLLESASQNSILLQSFILAICIAFTFLIYGLGLLFWIPFFNFALRMNLKPYKGPYYSLPAIRWYIHNGLLYLARYTFLEFITPSPLANLFYRAMGMKIGQYTTLNSTHISDPSLIEMGSHVTIGGSATLISHYGQGGLLILKPVFIGDSTTIGLKATIMAGAKIGTKVKILPHSVVLPNTVIPDGETWGGIPARPLTLSDMR